jgi:hypothetical protein
MKQIHDGAGRERTMSDNMKALQFALADLEQAQKALSNSPAHAHIRERMDKLIADVKKEIDQLRKDVA